MAKTELKLKLKTKDRFEGIARRIENTDQCMLTLPCKYTNKRVKFTVELVE